MFKKIFGFFGKKNINFNPDFNPEKVNKLLIMIENLIGTKPNRSFYFIKAFTHRSYLEKTNFHVKSNERLEFLGDAVLGKIVAEYLFRKYPNEKEGFLTKVRSSFVNKESLEEVGYHLHLDKYIFLNDKYLSNEKRKLGNIVADTVEAFIAAIYLDLGEAKVTDFINKYIIKYLVNNGFLEHDKNFKGQLLEYSHAHKLSPPQYSIVEQIGPQHNKIFKVRVKVGEKYFAEGVGHNKKAAEQQAAQKVLKELNSL